MDDAGWVRAFAPATVANVSCGFDLLGFALEAPGDIVSARRTSEPGVVLTQIDGDGGRLPREPEKNTASVAVARLLELSGGKTGIELRLEKGMPLSSGLGSSAASAVAAVLAANEILDDPFAPHLLLPCAAAGEEAAAGSPHLDNVAPCLEGGFLLVRGDLDAATFDRIPVPSELFCGMVHPHMEIETRKARSVLPASVPLAAAITQAGNVAALIAGLIREDWETIQGAMVDVIAEPARSPLVPGFRDMRDAAAAAGALGSGLSGSGPALFAFCRGRDIASRVASAMKEAYERGGNGTADAWVSSVGAPGAHIITDAG